ncbi:MULTISPECIES: hypothetical protein [Photorhabdus]|uniref:Uncharacterized protein n=1 Tax=Photorhabdus asymbiotica TaxID=291112 RepID=A0ABX9SRL0_9GAMM|nr:hypothetical protein [Photorhabdus asymbiotica]RKS66091.1 hypothetical protein BDD30_0372 [Photorhabdus asymbiotica]
MPDLSGTSKTRSLFFSAGYKLPQDIFEVVPCKERQAVTTDEAWEEEYNQMLYQIKQRKPDMK